MSRLLLHLRSGVTCISKTQNILCRCFGSAGDPCSPENLWEIYRAKKKAIEDAPLAAFVNPEAVFANNELSLRDIKVYGFDYDYTLASYTPDLHSLIYELGKDNVVNGAKYPEEISNFEYDPNFAVRGLHFDVRKGFFMKLDSFHNIQLGTVYRGLQPVSDHDVLCLYDGTHVNLEDMNAFYGDKGMMHQLVDLFALPEVVLIAQIIEYFVQQQIPFDAENVFYDVRNAVKWIHSSGMLHQKIMDNLPLYLQKISETKELLSTLKKADKSLFLITNSGFDFVDAGMRYMVGEDWQELFDVVIVNARKPKFFYQNSRPFRKCDPLTKIQTFDRVASLDKGKIYQQGNFYLMRQMTGWYGSQVLYFGDHVYSDLADPSVKYGWRTGAIIPELEHELEQQNNPDYKRTVRWAVTLQGLIENYQRNECPETCAVVDEWLRERAEIRSKLKSCINPKFGSLFRTHHNPTYFTRRLNRFADLYMSSLVNLLHYSVNHTFYPHRTWLPHEPQHAV